MHKSNQIMPSRSVLLNGKNSCGKVERKNREVNKVKYVESIADENILVITAVESHEKLKTKIDGRNNVEKKSVVGDS